MAWQVCFYSVSSLLLSQYEASFFGADLNDIVEYSVTGQDCILGSSQEQV